MVDMGFYVYDLPQGTTMDDVLTVLSDEVLAERGLTPVKTLVTPKQDGASITFRREGFTKELAVVLSGGGGDRPLTRFAAHQVHTAKEAQESFALLYQVEQIFRAGQGRID